MNVVDINTIKSKDWQRKRGGFGEIVQSVEDIKQCVDTILITSKGSIPLRPQFGCDVWKYLDLPIGLARMHIVREVVDALTLWEPRIENIRATVHFDDVQNGQAKVVISYDIKGSQSRSNQEVVYG